MMNLPVEFVGSRTADGVLLHGALVGRGERYGLLLVHGAWGSFYATPVFDLLQAAKERGFAALSMNSRGHDLGTLGDGEPCVGFMRDLFEQAPLDLDAAAEVLTAAGVERYVVVAHSYGAHKAAYWLAERRPAEAVGCVLVSPAPPLHAVARWWVDGAIEHHIARAAAAVAAGVPEELIVVSSAAPAPIVAEAQTLLSTWGPATRADSRLHVPGVTVPTLIMSGEREGAANRAFAAEVAGAAPHAELEVLNDNHYYSKDRPQFIATIMKWIGERGLLVVHGMKDANE